MPRVYEVAWDGILVRQCICIIICVRNSAEGVTAMTGTRFGTRQCPIERVSPTKRNDTVMFPLSIASIIRVRYLRVESRCILKGRHLVLVQSTAVTRDPVALSMKKMSWRPAAGDTGWNFQRQSNRISRNFRKFKGPVFWFNICIEIFRHCLKVA